MSSRATPQIVGFQLNFIEVFISASFEENGQDRQFTGRPFTGGLSGAGRRYIQKDLPISSYPLR
jgi:hypothetical protein